MIAAGAETREKNMQALIIGIGLQGRAVLYDLEASSMVTGIVAADLDLGAIEALVGVNGYKKVRAVRTDVTDREDLVRLIRDSGAGVVVCMLPEGLVPAVARACVATRVPFVSSGYTDSLSELDREARERDVSILPEMGMDPGIDLLIGANAIKALDEVHGLYSYGGGLPAPGDGDNPLHYKISWNFNAVTRTYKRSARFLRDGEVIVVPGSEIFVPANCHMAEFDGLGPIEAFPNYDALPYVAAFGLGNEVRDMARFALRWPGHCALWHALSRLGFLEDSSIDLGNDARISPRSFLVKHLKPRLQFAGGERDVVLLRIDAWGRKDGEPCRMVCELRDYRDLETGFFAMNRTVGFTSSIAAQFLLSGRITKAGVLSVARDVPTVPFLAELEARGMRITSRLLPGEAGRPGRPLAATAP